MTPSMYSPDAGLFIFFLPKEPWYKKALKLFQGCRNPDSFVLLKKVFDIFGFYDYRISI